MGDPTDAVSDAILNFLRSRYPDHIIDRETHEDRTVFIINCRFMGKWLSRIGMMTLLDGMLYPSYVQPGIAKRDVRCPTVDLSDPAALTHLADALDGMPMPSVVEASMLENAYLACRRRTNDQ